MRFGTQPQWTDFDVIWDTSIEMVDFGIGTVGMVSHLVNTLWFGTCPELSHHAVNWDTSTVPFWTRPQIMGCWTAVFVANRMLFGTCPQGTDFGVIWDTSSGQMMRC